jgi:hypothetical protein
MEFNDSSVSDWDFKKLKEDCFGDDPSASSGWGRNWGGKSAYMLFYERVIKKPIKILVP